MDISKDLEGNIIEIHHTFLIKMDNILNGKKYSFLLILI